jgi:hypothetical protein
MEPLDEYTNVVTFGVGPRALVQAHQPIAYQLRLSYILHHLRSSPDRFLSSSLHGHYLPIDHRTFIVRLRRRGEPQPRRTARVYAHLIHQIADEEIFSETRSLTKGKCLEGFFKLLFTNL